MCEDSSIGLVLTVQRRPRGVAARLTQYVSNIRWISSALLVLVRANARSRRAFHGWRLSPATKPRLVSPGLRTTRPDATRLQRHIIIPVSLYMRSKVSSSAGVGRPAPVPALTIPLAPAAAAASIILPSAPT